MNAITRKNNSHFISATTAGLFSSVFCDFGDKFVCVDTNGEQTLQGMVVGIDQDKEGMVTTLDESRHGLEDGDYVTFSEVEGMTEINDSEPRKVTVKGALWSSALGAPPGWLRSPSFFSIAQAPTHSPSVTPLASLNTQEAVCGTKSRCPRSLNSSAATNSLRLKQVPYADAQTDSQQKPLAESLKDPEHLITDFAKFDRPNVLHVGFQALSRYQAEHQGQLPAPRSESDASKVLAYARAIWTSAGFDGEVDPKVINELAFQAQGELSPVMAVTGAFVAQEALKACSGKFHPLFQHLYFDALEALPKSTALSAEECAPQNSRYDRQVAVLGKSFQDKLHKAKVFLVGSGAIGCEMLKNWAMMGVATEGKITVTDMDSIEKSNLNRQFLFRPKDLGQFKSDAAAAAVSEMNPALKGHIESRQQAVGEQTESECFASSAWYLSARCLVLR